jgi:hypothetical protein
MRTSAGGGGAREMGGEGSQLSFGGPAQGTGVPCRLAFNAQA